MSDGYIQFANSSIGKRIVRMLGLPQPAHLTRYTEGNPFLIGPTILGSSSGSAYHHAIERVTAGLARNLFVSAQLSANQKIKSAVYDVSGIERTDGLQQLHAFFSPIIRSFGHCSRVVLVGKLPSDCHAEHRVAQRAIVGFVKSLAKEMRGGGTVNLIWCSGDCQSSLAGPLCFLASDRSAYVSGQVLSVVSASNEEGEFVRPLSGRNILVTGAARGIGLAIARLIKLRGGNPICLDVPRVEKELRSVGNELDCDWLSLDVTETTAGEKIAEHFRTKSLYGIVHNAGLTRDRKLVNLNLDNWNLVLETNIMAQERINECLVDSGTITSGGRIVCVSSISGIAGGAGQTNYSTSKAAVIGMVEAYSQRYFTNGITINAVAPGFIETKMVATIPFAIRQLGRRLNSLAQGGLPIDVAEAVGLFLQPNSQGLTGNCLRVCGQALIGA